jgi:hypothetical protein
MRESEKGSLAIQLGKIDLKKLTLNDLLEYHLLSHSNMLKQILAVPLPSARKHALRPSLRRASRQAREAINKISIKPTVFDLDNVSVSDALM